MRTIAHQLHSWSLMVGGIGAILFASFHYVDGLMGLMVIVGGALFTAGLSHHKTRDPEDVARTVQTALKEFHR